MIDEKLAKKAWQNIHIASTYENGQATKEWEHYVEKAKEVLNTKNIRQEERDYTLERYKKKTSDWINEKNRVDSNHVSWHIAGPSNYNMRKQEQWENKINNLYKEYDYVFNINNYIHEKRVEIKQNIEQLEYMLGDIKVVQNTELNRLQLEFNSKPSDEIRDLLKSNGFKWSPKNSVWQRQLTHNALFKLNQIKDKLEEN